LAIGCRAVHQCHEDPTTCHYSVYTILFSNLLTSLEKNIEILERALGTL